MIFRQFGSEELLINFMKNMPEEVFMAPTEDDLDLLSQQEKKGETFHFFFWNVVTKHPCSQRGSRKESSQSSS